MTKSNPSNFDIIDEVTPTFVIDSSRGCKRVSGPTRRSTKGGWTPEADKLLMNAVCRYKGKHWKKIAECVPGRKDKRRDVQCQHRWQKVLNPNLNKGPWSKEEDDLLSELVKANIENDKPKWSNISKQLPGRIGKQCRERWHNHLNPTIKKTPWTSEEESILINAQMGHGNKWAEIAKLLPGRSENNIKNHWNCSVKKRLAQFPSSPISGSRSSSFESNLDNQGNIVLPERDKPFQIKDVAKSPQRDSLDLTLGSIWNGMLTSTSSHIGEKEKLSSSIEFDWSRHSRKVALPHWMPSSVLANVLESPKTPQSSNESVCIQEVKEIRERLRMAASTFKNTPSIISKSSSPASCLKRRRQQEDTSFQTDCENEKEHSISNSPSSKSRPKHHISFGSKPLERRLEFDFI